MLRLERRRQPGLRVSMLSFALLSGGCEDPELRPPELDAPGDTDVQQVCDPSSRLTGLTVRLEGRVALEDGEPAEGVRVTLYDSQRPPGTALGDAITTSDGSFSLDAQGVTDWPGCWQIVLNYQLELRGDATVRRDVNREVFEAVRSDDLAYTFREPLVLSESN